MKKPNFRTLVYSTMLLVGGVSLQLVKLPELSLILLAAAFWCFIWTIIEMFFPPKNKN